MEEETHAATKEGTAFTTEVMRRICIYQKGGVTRLS